HSIVDNSQALADGGAERREAAVERRAAFSALVLAKDRASRDIPIWWLFADSPRAGGVIDAIAALDYRVLSRAELLRQPERARRAADGQLFDVLGGFDSVEHALATTALDTDEVVDGTTTADGPCATFTPNAPDGHLTLTGDDLSIRIEATGNAPVEVAARSIADGFHGYPAFTVAPGTSRDLTLRANGMKPWTVRLSSVDAVRACATVP
ncbi:MAG TPA: hypothetical protein VFZ17_14355, partial [Acidimicrobiia bacterium]|nr:hypothetical protein [Acidimicrobiia bacterium]